MGSLSVSNQTDPNNRQGKQSPFAPRRVHGANDRERRQDAARPVNPDWTEFRERLRSGDSESSPADEGQARRQGLSNLANPQEPPPWSRQRLAEGEFPEDSEPTDDELPQRRLPSSAEAEAFRSRHSLDPVVVREPPPPQRAGRGLAPFVGLAAAALIGAAAALFINGNFAPPSNKTPAPSTDGASFTSRLPGDIAKAA